MKNVNFYYLLTLTVLWVWQFAPCLSFFAASLKDLNFFLWPKKNSLKLTYNKPYQSSPSWLLFIFHVHTLQ